MWRRLQSLYTLAARMRLCAVIGLLAAQSLPALAGQVVPFTLDSPVLGRAWVNQIYLPHGYSDGAIYPVNLSVARCEQRFSRMGPPSRHRNAG